MYVNEPRKSSNSLGKPNYLIIKDIISQDYKINYIYLIAQLIKKKWLIIIITAFSTLLPISLIYTIIKPQYMVTSYLSEPSTNQYNHLFEDIKNMDTTKINADLFGRFMDKLKSKDNLISFLKNNSRISKPISNLSADAIKDQINLLNKLSKNYVIKITPNKDKIIYLSTISLNPVLSLNNNKAYIEYTNKKILDQIEAAQKERLQHLINILTYYIKFEPTLVSESKKLKLQYLSSLLETLHEDMSNISCYYMENEPIVSINSYNKKLVLSGIIFGLLFSIFIIILQSNIIEMKENIP